MAITYNWLIPQLDCVPSQDGLTNVVQTVHWRLYAEDGTYRGIVYGSQQFPSPDSANFIPYEDLSKDQVIEWVKESLIAENQWGNVEESLQKQIADQKNPPIVQPPLPWS